MSNVFSLKRAIIVSSMGSRPSFNFSTLNSFVEFSVSISPMVNSGIEERVCDDEEEDLRRTFCGCGNILSGDCCG